jgi:hypothetical protein
VCEGDGAPGSLQVDSGPEVGPVCLTRRHGHGFWRYDFALSLTDRPRTVTYRVAGTTWPVRLPARNGEHHLAYAACSGTDAEETGTIPASRNALWRQLEAEHQRRPFHLLLQGGDQLYADTLWDEVPELGAWRRLSWARANAHPFTASMAREVERYYFRRYRWLWGQKEIAPLLASIPSLMMWDDHDIFDGWGSWPDDRQHCPVFRGLFGIARQHFALFQLAALTERLPEGFADPLGGHFGWALRTGEIGIIAPDLRSERTRAEIMGEAGWRDFERQLASLEGCRHLLMLSSVPLVNTDMSPVERIYVAIPGHTDLEDDLRDQWQSFSHRDEWHRMLSSLLRFAARTGARVTSLSGEIHLGALGHASGEGAELFELTSSGIVHEPPPALVTAAYAWIGRRRIEVAPGLTAGLLKIPGHGRRYLRARNWLSLDMDGRGGLTGVWHTEKGEAGRLELPPLTATTGVRPDSAAVPAAGPIA